MRNIKLYIRQSWAIAKQNKLFSAIYVLGTGLSIALIMTLFIVIYVKTAPLYPEYKRDRTLEVVYVQKALRDITGGRIESMNRLASYNLLKMLENLPHLEEIGASTMNYYEAGSESYIEVAGFQEQYPAFPLYVDDGYWRVFDFNFLHGKPFSKVDFESFTRVAVLSQSFAKLIYASDDVVGKLLHINGVEYKVCGVVKDVPSAMSNYTTSDIWLPYSVAPNQEYVNNTESLLGDLKLLLVAKSNNDVDELKAEINDVFKRFSQQDKKYEHSVRFGPDLYINNIFKTMTENGLEMSNKLLYILLALIFIPALNLSGLISSKMNKRLPELGIRKTYGATNGMLLSQVLWENMLLTTIGGVVGLVLCLLVVFTTQEWMIALFNTAVDYNVTLTSGKLSPAMLFNWQVFMFTLLICFILNIVSAIIPAVVALRQTIINSLNLKK